MRRALAVLLAAVALLAAGCQDDPAPTDLAVTTPPASATAGVTPTATGAPSTVAPPPPPPPTATSVPVDTPLGTYENLVAGWQAARSAFFAAVSDGRRRTVAQQRALAVAYLTGSRRFAAGLRATRWPAAAQPAVRDLLAANAAQQSHLVAMATAPSAGAFTGRLADYGVGAARENAAVAAARGALS